MMQEESGAIHRLEPNPQLVKPSQWSNLGTPADGSEPWNYHDVWVSDEGMVHDPMDFPNNPDMPVEDWLNTPGRHTPAKGDSVGGIPWYVFNKVE
jgi:hypothetical protein